MGTVWIVEKSVAIEESCCRHLMGDYAVRLFASIESFHKLLRINRRNLPDVLVVGDAACPWDDRRLKSTLSYYMPNIPCIRFGQNEDQIICDQIIYLNNKADGLLMSRMISDLLTKTQGDSSSNKGVMRFRDLQLNFAQVEFCIVSSGERQSLPLKEAQILKLFLERPNVCISRDEIQKMIWSGLKISSRTVDSHVSRLRKRLLNAEVEIESIYGGGYVLK